MFESDEENDDPEVKKQIEAVLEKNGSPRRIDIVGRVWVREFRWQWWWRSGRDQAVLRGSRGDWGAQVETEQSENWGHRFYCRTGECRKSNRFQARCPIQKHPMDQTRSHQGQGSQQWDFQQSSCLQTPTFSCGPRGIRACTVHSFGAAALAQATSMEEDTICHLENYTGLLTGLLKLVVTMASGYEAATEDIRSLVASTLDVATQHDRTFVAGASQALADWTAKYQHAMSQGENQSMNDQLAHWDRVREAGIALSHHITSLTTEHDQSTVSAEIFRTLIPACFQRVWARTEATFSEVHATPSLFAVQVRGSGPGRADIGLHLHLPV